METATGLPSLDVLSMKDLLNKAGFDLPRVGQTLEGEVINASKNAVLIDLGGLGTGIVYPGEFYDNAELQKSLKPGQRVPTILLDIEGDDGYRELSLKRAQMTTAWQDIRNKKEKGEVITTKVVNINKGGLIVEINGIQGFLPLSQLASEHYPKVQDGDTTKIVQSLQKLRNTDIQVKIIDFFEDENRLIVSERAINDAQILEEIVKFKVGELVSGEVTDVTDFGAFVKIGSQLEGLIHISEIDWKLIDDPRDFLTPGQTVQAKIVTIEGTKVSLSLKALKPDPWEKIETKYTVGQALDGKIAKISNYGAFVQIDEKITGLIPLSEFSGKKPSEVLTVGDIRGVAIVAIDPKERKLLLTLQKSDDQKEETKA